MEDRIPTAGQEGRVLITPENGSAPFYATVTMADNPTNPGTPLNKATLLQDSTEVELFGNSANRTVDEAFSGIAGKIALIMSDSAAITVTVKDQNGNPIPEVYVDGILGEDGDTVITNSSGVATGYIQEGQSTVSISRYADIEPFTKVFSITKGETYTETLEVMTKNFTKITNSGNIVFSGNVQSVSFQCQGGGGGGTASNNTGYTVAGSGGAGGDSSAESTQNVSPNTPYPVIIGSGGAGEVRNNYDPAGTGGTTTFMGISASGGQGSYWSGTGSNRVSVPGTGPNGDGGTGDRVWGDNIENKAGQPGGNGKKQIFSSYTETVPAAGGGASGNINGGTGATGGTTGGGQGGGATGSSSTLPGGGGVEGTGGGGGGGGARTYGDSGERGAGGKGGKGCVVIRMNLVHSL